MNCVAHKQLCTQANMYTSTQAQKPLSTTITEAGPKCLHLVAGTASLCESGDSDGKWFDARQVLCLLRFLNDALNVGSGFQRRKQQCKNALESRVPGFEVTSCNLYHMQMNFHPLGAPGQSFSRLIYSLPYICRWMFVPA